MPNRKKGPVCLVIRDGWGKGKDEKSNAIFCANTKYYDEYIKKGQNSLLRADGRSVGLPKGNQGNSEVGHLTLGSGRIIYQSLTRIDHEIETGNFFKNKAFIDALKIANEKNSSIHLVGLIQEEGVHSVTRHAGALLKFFKENSFNRVLIHALTDGRDTPPKSAVEHMELLQKYIDETKTGRVASVIGRYFAMDRDKRWDRTKLAYDAIMKGEGEAVSSWQQAIDIAYANGENDEFIKPKLINYNGIKKDDIIIFFNYRFDRTRQLTMSIAEKNFTDFETIPHNIHFITMTHYYDNGNFVEAYPPIPTTNLLGEVIAKNGLSQLRCAETEKYAHVTFFFNGQQNDPFENEDRILVNSPKVATYDLKPEMSAYEVKDKLLEAIESDKYDVIITNFANCDMVGHTGIFDAIVKAVEVVDECVHAITEKILAKGGVVLLTADHGNAEQTQLEDGSPMTAHTTNPVPLTILGLENRKLKETGELSDIAPTMLDILGINIPEEMTGKSLLS